MVARTAPRPEWLARRREMICGSDIAAVIYDPELWDPDERKPYVDRYTLWLDKTGQAPLDKARTRDMRRGQLFETPILDLWREEPAQAGIRFTRSGLWRSNSEPLAGVTPDLICWGCSYGDLGGVDAKTQNYQGEWGTDWEPRIPTIYQFSGQWCVFVLGADHMHFPVLGPFYTPYGRVMYRDDVLIEYLLAEARKFWADHVLARVAPDATAISADALSSRWPNPPYDRAAKTGETYQLNEAEGIMLLKAAAAARTEARAKQRKEDLIAYLQAHMGTATEALWPQDWVGVRQPAVTWRPSVIIDGATAEWREANPELSATYATVTEVRGVDTAKLAAARGGILPAGLYHRRAFNMTRLTRKGPKE